LYLGSKLVTTNWSNPFRYILLNKGDKIEP